MLTASVTVDLSFLPDASAYDQDFHDRKRLERAGLDGLPDGTRVIILTGRREWDLTPSAIAELHRHVERLHLDIRGDAGRVIAAWHRAISSGEVGA